MSVSFSGLASGLDTKSLVSSLVQVARAPETSVLSSQSNLRTQKDILTDLESKLSDLATAAHRFDLGADAQSMTATLSDASHVSVAVSGGAAPAVHAIRVLDTAQAQVVTSRTFSTSAAGVLSDGSATFKRAGQSDVVVSWKSTDSLADIADRITQSGAGVSASVLYDGTSYRLLVGATATGTAAASTFVDGGDGLGLSDPGNITVPARDARLSVDGVTITRGSNIVDDALPGMTITALAKQAAADPDTAVNVGIDAAGTRANVQALVDGFNKVASAISDQLSYSGTPKGPDTLFGDISLQMLQRSMADLVTGTTFGTQLSTLGVSLGRDGQLSLDSTKFDAAVKATPGAVKALFTTGGFAKAMTDLTDQYTRPGDGLLLAKSAGIDSRIKVYQNQYDNIEANAIALQNRLNQQFDALETTMSKLKSQSGSLASLYNSSSSG